jgi:DNA-binding NarL/FixJ family response regulator
VSLRLLLADDHPLIREGLRASLADQGFTVVAEAHDGRSAVDLALEHRPDVVVLDIGMPDLDGLEACRRIISRRPGARVLVLAAHDDPQIREAAKSAGAMGYVAKSASTREITEAVRALARGESMLTRVGGAETPGRPAQRVAQLDKYFRPSELDGPVLTRRESEVLQLFANGKSTVEVARTLTISQKTVKNHLTSIYQKLNVRDRTEAVLLAVRMGLIRLERREKPRS